MAFILIPIALGVLQMAGGLPVAKQNSLDDLMMVDDTVSVGSYIRETRAAAPDDWHKSEEHDGDGEIGYSRKKSGGGKKGYQHFDSYHKKAGDNYEFEKQDSFGLEDKNQDGAYSHNHERRVAREQDPEAFEEFDEERIPQRSSKQEKHEKGRHYEELKEGAADGNGGVEAYGHDPSDYVLPERYVIESDEN